MPDDPTFEWPATESSRQVGPGTETLTITNREIVVSYRDPTQCLTPELLARLQAYWAARIERILWETMAGYVPVREDSVLRGGKSAQIFPNGNRPVAPQRGPWSIVADTGS